MSSFNSAHLDLFYKRLKSHLLKNNIEKKDVIIGYSDNEIQTFEKSKDIRLPEAYYLFLAHFGLGQASFFDGSYFSLDGYEFNYETAEELLKIKIPKNIFVFTQWQGYNYHCFKVDEGNNPEVFFGIIASDDPADDRIIERTEGRFTDWLCNLIRTSLKYRKKFYGLEIEELLNELEDIKNIPTPL